MAQKRRAWLYVAGVLGPFGAGVMNPMIPELRDAFGVSTGAVAWGLIGYLLPFAALLLVSGTLGTRWGVATTLRGASALYAPVTLLCAFAPSFAWFLTGRVMQGVLNAFTTPLLLTSLTEDSAPQRRGRVVGMYAAFQSLGQLLAPVLGGISADIDWRLAFVGVALMSALVAVMLPRATGSPSALPGATSTPGASSPPALPGTSSTPALPAAGSTPAASTRRPYFEKLFTRPVLLLGATALFAAAGPLNVILLVALTARDRFGMSGGATGALLLAGTGCAMVLVQPWGRLLDIWGTRRALVAALVMAGLLVALLGRVGSVLALVLVWTFTGAVIQFVVVGFQSLAANMVTDNRGGVMSLTLSHRFFGHSLGALVWVPVFTVNASLAYTASALMALLAIAAVLGSGLGRPSA